MKSVKLKSLAVDRLERVSGRKRRRKQKRRGDPYPIENTKSGGGKKSKRKGSNFEGDIAKLWKAYYGCSVRRTPGSGGWGTMGGDEWATVKGDLVFSMRVPYHIECKKHEEWDLADLITGMRGIDTTSTNSIEKWWEQAVRDCPRKKIPMLIFARNRKVLGNATNIGIPPLLMIRPADLRALEAKSVRKSKRRTFLEWTADMLRRIEIVNDVETRWIITLDDFFRHIRPPVKSPRWKAWKRSNG